MDLGSEILKTALCHR